MERRHAVAPGPPPAPSSTADGADGLQSRAEWLAAVAHELRTPLNSIIGFAEIIAGEMLGPDAKDKYREYARDIGDAARLIQATVDDILDLARIEDGRALSLAETHVQVPGLLDACRRLIEGRAAGAGIEIDVRAAPGLGAVADERRLTQMILNLLANALDFTPDGGHVTLAAETGGDGGIRFRVSDTGSGIAEADMEVVLMPFGQGQAQSLRRTAGSGLGLTMARAIAEAHGGTLAIASRPGTGTTVTVTLPTARTRMSA